MDVKTFSDQLRIRMNEQMEIVKNNEDDELNATAKIIQIIRDCLLELKQFIHQYEFGDQNEEIHFFKLVKPGLQSKYFFNQWVFDMELETAFLDYEKVNKFYKEQLVQMRAFQARSKEFYLYFKSGRKHHDHQYFVRKNSRTSLYPDVDCRFSTGYDNKVARILAQDMLKDYLKKKMSKVSENEISGFTWTASKTDLVELIYALHAHQCLDYGNINVKELFDALVKLFNVNLGDYYRTWLDIRIRKTGRTKFLDALKISLGRRMEELD